MKISDHPMYPRMRTVPAEEAASWVIADKNIATVDKSERKKAFKEIGRNIISGRSERKKYGFNSDSASEIARALEWTFKAGQNSVS